MGAWVGAAGVVAAKEVALVAVAETEAVNRQDFD